MQKLVSVCFRWLARNCEYTLFTPGLNWCWGFEFGAEAGVSWWCGCRLRVSGRRHVRNMRQSLGRERTPDRDWLHLRLPWTNGCWEHEVIQVGLENTTLFIYRVLFDCCWRIFWFQAPQWLGRSHCLKIRSETQCIKVIGNQFQNYVESGRPIFVNRAFSILFEKYHL